MEKSKKGAFLRESSGLVREFGILDALWFNIALLGLLFSTYYVASTGPLVGGNPLLGLLLPIVGFFLVGIIFSYVGSKVPRVAADYVYVSRNLHPALGFVGNAGYFLATVPLFMGITGITLQTFGLIPLLTILGYYTHNPSLIVVGSQIDSNPYLIMVIGAVEIVIMSLIPIFGNKVYRAFQWIAIPLALIAAIGMIIVEASVPHSLAIARLNNFASVYANVSNLYANVTSSNAPVPAYYNIYNIISLNPVYVVGFSYIINTIYVAGEVRNPKRSMPISILGTLIITGFIFTAALALEYNQFGYDFTTKMMYLSIVQGTLPIPTPYLDLLEGIASGNIVLGVLFALASIVQLLMYLSAASFVGSRLLFSYAMDRIMPDFVGDVSEKRHVPIKAIILSMIAGLIGLTVFTLPVTSAGAFLLSSVAVAILMLFPMAILSIAVLKTEKNENKIRIIAALSIIYLIYTFYQYLTVPAIGADSIVGYGILAGSIVILFIIFYVAKFIRARQGIDFNLIFKEIPPE
ncbi:amino acid permease [Saccharolobus solfataricus]|nr:amino acid permease [Saccharolobus solfataricus]AKA72929.1 amino acid permease [Saccharolobus solfataricus]AKA75628.1 amino acid permease [Saccharolobus solfataricus]AKA78321.1 amino acid permease [Saccharolobus solfataricus]AZF67440.1 amino acid permease [Saccharolobus solfataricus]AZF70060.1 amino acid permease [Saccharolobus solfataricus]